MWRSAASRRFQSTLFSPLTANRDLNHTSILPTLSNGMLDIYMRQSVFLLSSQVHSSAIGGVGDVTSVGGSAMGGQGAAIGSGRAISSFHEVFRHYGRCYWELSKAKLSMLVVATSGAGYVLGSGGAVDFAGLCCTCAGTMMVAASASTLNQVFEKENDTKMKRTCKRPLPSGRISIPHAAMWASTVGLAGTSLLAWQTNSLATGLAASNLFLYAFVYTPLKQIHPINTWVGAVVGAIPPLLGWAAASSNISVEAMILPAALYFWQIPHFMALAYMCRDDYLAGGFRMFSFNDPSGWRTALVSFRNCLYLLPLGWLAYEWGLTSEWFVLESTLLTLGIGIASLLFVNERTTKNARRMFYSSLLYLPIFMSGLLLHRLPSKQHKNNNALAEIGQDRKELIMYNEIQREEIQQRKMNVRRAPVAYASIAPFPFLPAPLYFPPDS
ncbi:cytochrome c oxidase 10 [Carex rostrata]